jgi:Type II secretion system (T2SS), protein G
MRTALLVAWASCVFAAWTPPLPAQDPTERRPFLRMIDNEIDGRLELLIATYTKGSAELVLYAALHIADPAHYQDLQQRFEAHDALLYELIADPEHRPSPGTRTEDDWFNMFQGGMGRGFGLVHQGDHIDYRPANFVHADMSPEEWEEALRRAGSSLIGEAIGMSKNHEPDREAEAAQGRIDLVAAFRSGKGAYELRRLGAQMMVQPDPQRDEPTVIIEGRNDKCLRVLAEQLAAGKQKLGIYYGAGHMEHLERRLLQDLGWKRTGEQWVTAWDNSKRLFPVAEKGLQQKRYRARQDLEALTTLLQAWQSKNPGKAPALDLLRKEATDGRLPGRSDGKDPWGRDYVLRQQGDAHEVRCLGSDGVIDTEDDQAGNRVDDHGAAVTKEEEEYSNPLVNHFVQQRRFRQLLEQEKKLRAEEIEAKELSLTIMRAQRQLRELAPDAVRLRQELARTPTLAELRTRAVAAGKPFDDPWGTPLRIVDDAALGMVLRSSGPDRLPDTADDVIRPTSR